MSAAAISATIHALVAHAGMTDEQYRQMLEDRFHVTSSKALTPAQAGELIRSLRELLPATLRAKYPSSRPLAGTRKRFEHLANRGAEYATPPQLRMLEAEWSRHSRQVTLGEQQDAFHAFLHRYGVDRLEWVLKADVGRLLYAIQHVRRDAPPRTRRRKTTPNTTTTKGA